MLHGRAFAVGDRVVMDVRRRGVRPEPAAMDVQPEAKGEGYVYRVRKYGIVQEVTALGRLLIATSTGERLEVNPLDPQLRRAAWWELLLERHRFQALAG